jgi:hypothetical protein
VNASRKDDARMVDYSALGENGPRMLRYQIVRFVRGIRVKRENPVTSRQIYNWFGGTPAAFVSATLDDVIHEGFILCTGSLRAGRNNVATRTYYEVTDSGIALLKS